MSLYFDWSSGLNSAGPVGRFGGGGLACEAVKFAVFGAGLASRVAFSAPLVVDVVALRSIAHCTLVGLFIYLKTGIAE